MGFCGRCAESESAKHNVISPTMLSRAILQRGARCRAAGCRHRAYFSTPAQQPAGLLTRIGQEVAAKPGAYALIPTVAAGVGLVTNWMGVKMMFVPLEYRGLELHRFDDAPYGLFGWQGVVPFRTEKMARRLTEIVTTDLLSLREAFSKIDPNHLASLLMPPVLEAIRRDAPNGEWWAWALRPFLWPVLRSVAIALRAEIEEVLDLEQVVMTAFVRDKQVLVDLFQRVGRSELDFLCYDQRTSRTPPRLALLLELEPNLNPNPSQTRPRSNRLPAMFPCARARLAGCSRDCTLASS